MFNIYTAICSEWSLTSDHLWVYLVATRMTTTKYVTEHQCYH